LKPEAEDSTSTGQKRVEVHYLEKGKVYSKPFQSKMPMEIDHPLEPEPRVEVQLPKPEPRGEETPEDYASPLDKLVKLPNNFLRRDFWRSRLQWQRNRSMLMMILFLILLNFS